MDPSFTKCFGTHAFYQRGYAGPSCYLKICCLLELEFCSLLEISFNILEMLKSLEKKYDSDSRIDSLMSFLFRNNVNWKKE